MGYITVKYLGEDYQVSETLNEFLGYDKLLNPIRNKLLNTIPSDAKKDSRLTWDGSTMTNHVHSIADKYRKMVQDGAELLVKKLLELGVYDVTANDLLNNVNAIGEINNLENRTFATLLEEGHRFVDLKNAGLERAYNYAASNITGSGVRVFTSSFSMLMINSVVERSILMSQAKKADKEYEEAARNISAQTSFALDKLYREVMVKEFYPSVMEIILDFDSKVMSIFLMELTTHGKFDFESVEKYNMQKAEEMLKNINKVPDKREFLKQAFLTCPFSIEVYVECLKQGLLDAETFETAKYFGFADELATRIDDEISKNIKNTDKIKPYISILASYRRTTETEIKKKLYQNTLENIKSAYKAFNNALSDKRSLDKIVREIINNDVKTVINKSKDEVINCVDRRLTSIISENQYNEFVGMGILSPEDVRMIGSTENSIVKINNEYSNSLVSLIMEYINEATERKCKADAAYEKYNNEIKKMTDAITIKQNELSSIGLFAFSKKKELKVEISRMEAELNDYKKNNNPKGLMTSFKKIYS